MGLGIRVLIHDDLLVPFKEFLKSQGERLDGPYSDSSGGTYYIIRKSPGQAGTPGINGFGTNTSPDPGEVVR